MKKQVPFKEQKITKVIRCPTRKLLDGERFDSVGCHICNCSVFVLACGGYMKYRANYDTD